MSGAPERGDRSGSELLHWRAVGTGAAVGLGLLVVVSIATAALDRWLDDFDENGWIYPLFVAVLVSYALGGFVAVRGAMSGPLTTGALAGMGAFASWVPVRVLIWLARGEDNGLFTGTDPVLRPGQVFTHVLLAAAFGMLGGWIGARTFARARRST